MAQNVKYYDDNIDLYTKSQQDFLVKSYNKTRAKSFLHKLGNSLGLVVVTLPLAGLFAAVGGIIMSKGSSEGVYTLGLILSDLGQSVLSNLGLLFMLAIILGFTGNKGMALYAGVIGYIAFVGFSIPFIRYNGGVQSGTDPSTFSIWFWHNQDVNTQLANIFGLGQGAVISDAGVIGAHGEFARLSYQGIKTLNTGVLGGIALGFVYTWIYNKFKDLKLPSMLAFFEGEKFVALLVIVMAPIIAAVFIVVWPGVNFVLEKIGVGLSYLPYGIDSFFYGLFNRWLLPFEAHPAFYGPLWWTSAGGTLAGTNEQEILYSMVDRIMTGKTVGIGQEANYYNNVVSNWIDTFKNSNGQTLKDVLPGLLTSNINGNGFNGRSVFEALKTDGFSFGVAHEDAIRRAFIDYGKINWTISGDQLMSIELLNNNPAFDMRDAWAINLKVTRYISGAYGTLMIALPAIGFAIWSTLDKDRRKQKFGLYIGAILSSFLLGITEPIEFMLAFGAPIIFFGIYAPFFGAMFLFGNLLQVRLGSTFSEGLLDYVINGLIPTFTRSNDGIAQTHFWIPLVIGVVGAMIAFPLFRFVCIKMEFAAPGSAAAEEGTGVSQSTYSEIKPNYDGLVSYLGGTSNIVSAAVITDVKARIAVKRADRVINNEFTEDQIESVFQKGNVYEIEAQGYDNDGAPYLKTLSDYIAWKDKEINFKATKKAEKEEFKAQLADMKKTIKNKADLKQQIKAAKVEHKKAIKRFNIEKARTEKINKVKAKWQFKQQQLPRTTEIDIAKYNYKTGYWATKNFENIAALKALYRYDIKLAGDKEIGSQIASEYRQTLAKLKPNEKAIKAEKTSYQKQIKQLKAAKKAGFKKERKE